MWKVGSKFNFRIKSKVELLNLFSFLCFNYTSIEILFFNVSKAPVKFDLSVFHKHEVRDSVLCPLDLSLIIFSIFLILIWDVPDGIEEMSIV
jgi:hypothetical protein